MKLRTPLKRARRLGSAKSGTGHWWRQRLTAIALAPLVIWLGLVLIEIAMLDQSQARAVVAAPWNAALLIALLVALFWHAALGLQVIVEDYVHVKWQELSLLVLIKFGAVLAVVAAIVAVGRITFGA